MAQELSPLFTFVCADLPADAFKVVRFNGVEGLSTLYRFEILLVCADDSLDLEAVLASPATLTIRAQPGGPASTYHGILENLEQLHKVGDYVSYHAVLVPRLWLLTRTRHNLIFQDQTPRQIIESCLRDGGLLTTDYEARIQSQGTPWPYACLYNESHFHFFSHWAERYGYYYYFDQSGAAEKLIFTDTFMSHEPLADCPILDFASTSGLDGTARQHLVRDFKLKLNPLQHNIKLKNYHYEQPDLDLQVEELISPTGVGELYTYGENFSTRVEGQLLARIRAQEQLCQHRLFTAGSEVAPISPGYQFTLRGHYRPDFNCSYLITGVSHEGGQEGYLISRLGIKLQDAAAAPGYRNRFTCIPATVQFRPPRQTEPSRIHGTISGKVDAAGSGQYAELDAQGRYKVIMPFDLSGKGQGKASTWLRKAGLYAGADHGIHFPLHKGAEVALSFHDGDPNRPYILLALPNPQTPNVVNEQSSTQCRIITAGQNQLQFEDQAGKEYVHLATPHGNTYIRLGFSDGAADGGGSGAPSPGTPNQSPGRGANAATYEPQNTMYQANYVAKDTGKDAGRLIPVPAGSAPTPRARRRKRGRPVSDCVAAGTKGSANQPLDPQYQWQCGVNQAGFYDEAGIVFRTDKRLSIKAGNQNSVILGENGLMVVGANSGVFAGANTAWTFLDDNKIVMGARTDMTTGPRLNMQVGPLKAINSSVDKVAVKITALTGSHNAVIGDSVRLVAQIKLLADEVANIANSHTTLVANVQTAVQQSNALAAYTNVVASATNTVADQANQVAGNTTAIGNSLTQVSNAVNTIAANSNLIATNSTAIGTECSNLFAIQTLT
ncbi:type VI secretion system tip protein TssI/VgrG [uncultured Thiodictyon sp.]|uniref:type VI secretion system tip protein TssI/VgrG n=1 Tax=uncultured Thiodictyon sp. TaxID=1846217 RepID=UPI0025F62B55|nr:type VI secretion system tip protein TssI/VgrG [uncultured Thiodictyon sp.]